MKNNLIRFIIIILVMFIVSTCSTDEEIAVSTDADESTTCATSSGSGPTVGNYTLQEALYVSQCISSSIITMEFKNNSSVIMTFDSYSDSTCAGSVSSNSLLCFDPLTVTSTTSTKDTYDVEAANNIGESITGYYAYGVSAENNTYILHFNIAPESNSVFWLTWADSKSKSDSNSLYIVKLTKK
jgi:hypothetical protein